MPQVFPIRPGRPRSPDPVDNGGAVPSLLGRGFNRQDYLASGAMNGFDATIYTTCTGGKLITTSGSSHILYSKQIFTGNCDLYLKYNSGSASNDVCMGFFDNSHIGDLTEGSSYGNVFQNAAIQSMIMRLAGTSMVLSITHESTQEVSWGAAPTAGILLHLSRVGNLWSLYHGSTLVGVSALKYTQPMRLGFVASGTQDWSLVSWVGGS